MKSKNPGGFIYCFTNVVNGKKYIGMSKESIANLKARHFGCAFKKNAPSTFACALRKYGWGSFTFEILFQATDISRECLSKLEVFCIKEEGSVVPFGYNMNSGGAGGIPNSKLHPSKGKTYEEIYGVERAQALKKSRSESSKQFKMSEEQKKKLSDLYRGKPRGSFSEEHKQKISAALKGKPKSQETKDKLSATKRARGSTYEEIHGKEKAELIKEKLRKKKILR